MGGECLHRVVEGVRDKCLGVTFEGLARNRCEVVAGREGGWGAGDQYAAVLDPLIQSRQGLRQGVEDLVVERVTAVWIGDADPDDRLGGGVEEELAAGEPLRPHSSTTRTSPSLTD